MRTSGRALLGLAIAAASACRGPAPPSPEQSFWRSLQSLCGRAFEGRVTESVPPDTAFAHATLTMHIRECSPDAVRIPFHVGTNRSRTWVVIRTGAGFTLKHDHHHADGGEDEVTQYGGDTRDGGTSTRQEFPADAHTATLIPAARANVWTLEIVPGRRFAYALRREGTERRFRAEFDLTRPVPAPPPPWGAR